MIAPRIDSVCLVSALAAVLGSAATSLLAQSEPSASAPSTAEVIVEVVDQKGMPVASAEVRLTSYEPDRTAECETRSDGACSLDLVPLVSDLYLTVNHREHEFYAETLDLAERGPRVLVRLPEPPWRMARGSGRVLDEAGEPVEGAAVTLYEMMEHVPNEWTAVTDALGEFAIEPLPEGSYSVTVEADGFADAVVGMWAADRAPPLELELVRGATVVGTIDGLTPSECRSSRVSATQVFEGNGFRVGIPFRGHPLLGAEGEVDERCAYQVSHLAPGHWLLGVHDSTVGRAHVEGLIELVPGQSEAVLDLRPFEPTREESPAIAGFVTDRHTGRPLEGARLRLATRTANSRGVVGEPRWSDERGEFTFPFSDPSVYVVASLDGFTTETIRWNGSEAPVRIDLAPTQGLHYRIRWFDGVDPEFVDMALVDGAGRRVENGWSAASEGYWRSAPEGEFTLEVSRGVIDLRLPVEIPGPELEVVIPPSGGAKLRIPELEADFGDGWLDGTTVEGRPLGTLQGTPPVRDEETVFLMGLTPGSWEITMTAPDGRTWSGRAEIELREVTVVYLR